MTPHSPLPIMNIWAIGRNYADHAKEMKAEIPTEPFIFLKSGACISFEKLVQLPSWSAEVHHEIEVGFQVDKNLEFSHICLALDLTERAVQSAAKAKGLPWTLAKSFTQSCPVSAFIPFSSFNDLLPHTLRLKANGELRQEGLLSSMIFKPDQILEYVKSHFPLVPGDLILSGTPSGVGPIKSNDRLNASLGTLLSAEWIFQQKS